MSTNDRDAIAELVGRLGLLVDGRDWPSLETLFSEEVDLDYSSLTGEEPQRVAASDLIAGWRENLGRLESTHHLIANVVIEIDGDAAAVAANVTATHVLENPGGGPLWTLGGRYDIEARRTPGGWCISGLALTVRWTSGNQAIMLPR